MKVENNNVVAVSYELRLNSKDSEIVDAANENHALQFIYGTGTMLEKFEENLNGLSENDAFEFQLESKDGYGEYNEQNISDIPKNAFEQNGKIQEGLLQIGNVIPLQDNKGRHYNGKVLEVTNDTVKLDFNHPLAGQKLFFTGKIVSIRKATEEEMAHGHVHDHNHHNHDDHECDGRCH